MSASLLLDDLPRAFRAARESASAGALYTPDTVPPATCRYCGRAWGRYGANDGHARCIVTPEFQRAAAELWWASPKLTREAIATACGVSVGTVAAWTNPRRIEVAQCG